MIANFFIWLINEIVSILAIIGNKAMILLPDSPFKSINEFILDSDLLTFLNWVIPIDVAVNLISLWIPTLFLIYLVRIVLKWVKAL